MIVFCFFFNDTATTEIYTLSLHDALPILADEGLEFLKAEKVDHEIKVGLTEDELARAVGNYDGLIVRSGAKVTARVLESPDRKSTRLNSSHANISYAVFCLKKKKYKQH